MRLPGGDKAIIEAEKLTGYCLNPEHPRGKHKARVFESVLGFTPANAEELRQALFEAAATAEATLTRGDKFGTRYVIEFLIDGPAGSATLRSLWILRQGEDTPRLTSCYVK
jgi:hypothetical protein